MNKYILLFTFLLFVSCKKESQPVEEETITEPVEVKKSNKNINISILLDLSDRINPQKYPNKTMEYYQRDAKYISAVSNAFVEHLKNKKVILLNDKIQLFFEPEPSSSEINKISNQLKFSFNRNSSKKNLFSVDSLYASLPLKIYESAIADNEYTGSDIWRFFKDKVSNYCISDNHRNILVILTDGYVFHKNTSFKEGNKTSYLTPQYIRKVGLNSNAWENRIQKNNYGYIPANSGLENLEVLVIGINPDDKNPFEKDVIKAYWSNWLKEMGVKKFELLDADLPSNQKSVIQNFILNPN